MTGAMIAKMAAIPASVLGGLLSLALERFTRRYPRATLQFDEVTSPGNDFPTLHNREHDLIVARIARPLVDENDLEVEILFQVSTRGKGICAQQMGPPSKD